MARRLLSHVDHLPLVLMLGTGLEGVTVPLFVLGMLAALAVALRVALSLGGPGATVGFNLGLAIVPLVVIALGALGAETLAARLDDRFGLALVAAAVAGVLVLARIEGRAAEGRGVLLLAGGAAIGWAAVFPAPLALTVGPPVIALVVLEILTAPRS